MCSLFPEESELTPEYFIENHTILPFYKPFIPTERYQNAVQNLKNGAVNAVLSGLGITAGSICSLNGIKYCPQCIIEDRELYEKAYIHRTHQLQGAFACGKHNMVLNVINKQIDKGDGLFDINSYEGFEDDAQTLDSMNENILALTSDLYLIMANTHSIGSLDTLRKKYIARMHEREYISPMGLINQVKLHSEFMNFYPRNFLNQMQCQVNIDDENSWLRIITRKKIKVVHPIRHLLFIRFLFGSIEQFILYKKTQYHPFGEPPYPCMNNESNHFEALLIDTCVINTNHITSKSIGTFKCSQCHYTYSLDEIDFISYGFELSKCMIQRVDFEKANGMNNPKQMMMEEKYKIEIDELLLNGTNLSRRDIIKKCSNAYRWLYKHNREWLLERIPTIKKHKDFYINTRIDWEQRDIETLEKVKQAVDTLYNSQNPIRITTKQIAETCNYNALPRDAEKMPLTKSCILQKAESLEQFHKRKIDEVIKTMEQEEIKLIRHAILRKSGISGKNYHDYDDYIDKKIET